MSPFIGDSKTGASTFNVAPDAALVLTNSDVSTGTDVGAVGDESLHEEKTMTENKISARKKNTDFTTGVMKFIDPKVDRFVSNNVMKRSGHGRI